jgi:hypothetical protein
MQKTCSIPCALTLVAIDKARARQRDNKQAKRDFRENDIKWWLRVGGDFNLNGGNVAFWLHKWVREVRDKDQPCPMCGARHYPRGGQWHACHYRSRGAAKQLRFEPDNIYKGCKHCNTWTEGDTGAKFRAGIVLRIGEERVAELDSDNSIHRWTIDECRPIRDFYKGICKEEL